MNNTTNFPPGWDEERVQRLLRHYESLSGDEDGAAFETDTQELKSQEGCCPRHER